ncbi:molybdopterin oxidoreductase family protein [Paracraurococcus lichenis]|uniref:Molybdopterin oxidoreductase family protein n=1 Tax=Paracraurococcus lichenis TaxID=3064888 RepID=A0ABT9E6C6_9PROT|nr:molybdopterin oxidoreductase family protein [Paracraurococcus sp. LOR1-02]MDO9711730.1 molybdopterin oxidoreductase family protein [Paracraurococcus sp. LOR1-02]
MPEAPTPTRPQPPPDPRVDYSAPVGDTVKTTTCYMCACRCGIRVHLKDGRIRYIEGNPDHPVNRGVICGKGSAGIMTQYAPARLSAPLLRVGERGSGEFREISWPEAMDIATGWLKSVRETAPERLAFFTGRDQSQSLTGFWAAQFGTPNFAAHGGFCSVNMAAGGLYSIGGSFWEFGEPDWDRAKYVLMFGVAEDHDSNPIKLGLSRVKARGAKFVSVNPVRTGYSAIADEWVGIRPGTDGLFVLALVHELLRNDKVDLDFLARYTNAAWLVVRNPGGADDGLFARDEDGCPLAWDRARGAMNAKAADLSPVMVGDYTLPDGRTAQPVFHLLAERYLAEEYAPETVAARCGLDAARIRRIAAEIADVAFNQAITLDQPWTDVWGRTHAQTTGRPVAFHAMRGISAHSNGFHTCRALHLLQMLLGAVDTPGSWRYKSPFPRPIPPGPPPAGKGAKPNTPLQGNILSFPHGPDDLLVDDAGNPLRIDKAFSWEAPLALHGMMHTVIGNAGAGDPYPIDTLFMFMANMAWNSAMNPGEVIRILTEKRESGDYVIPHVIYSDAYFSETVPYADLILPDTTYLERWDCISVLDRPIGSAHGAGDAIRQPVITPDRDVRPFQEVLIELGARLGLPAFVTEDGSPRFKDYPDYIVNHQRAPGVGPLAGFRGADGSKKGLGEPNPDQLRRYIENGCFWRDHLPSEQSWYKHANQAYLDGAKAMGFIPRPEQIVLQLWSEPLQKFRLAAEGHGERQPPEHLRARVRTYCDPLPIWYPPLEQQGADLERFELSAVTQRPMAMYHSWGSMNAWLRQIHGANKLYMARERAAAMGLVQDDWAWVESRNGRLKCQVSLMEGVNPDTVWTWNAIGKRAGAWGLSEDSPEALRGFLLNHVISEWLPAQEGFRGANADPVTGQAAWYDLRVRVTKAESAGQTEPHFSTLHDRPGAPPRPDILKYTVKTRA